MTKAEEFASASARTNREKSPKKQAKRAKQRATRARTGKSNETGAAKRALRKVSGRPAGAKTARRNVTDDTREKETVALEDSGNGRPSRKSTRSGANRMKPESQLQRRQTRRTAAPKSRATRAAHAKA